MSKTKEKIKIWDESHCSKHVINLVNGIHNLLIKNNITEISYVDIGSNVGKVYDLLSEKVTINKVWMFEASELLFEYSKEKYINNNKVILHHGAVNNNEDIVDFDESSMIYQIEHSDIDEDLNFGLSKIMGTNMSKKIKSIKLSNFFNSEIFENVKFIKIDTETVDFNILEDILLIINKFNFKPIIEFEINYMYAGLSKEDAQNVLDKFLVYGYHKLNIDNCYGDGVLVPSTIENL
jgi:FkbM family methyltransferase